MAKAIPETKSPAGAPGFLFWGRAPFGWLALDQATFPELRQAERDAGWRELLSPGLADAVMDQFAHEQRPSDEQLVYRPAVPDDSRAIADLICQAGGGLYEFLFDDLIPLVGARDIVAAGVGMSGGPLSYENCLVASSASEGVVGVANFFPADSLAEETFLSLVSDRFDHISPMLRLRDPGSMFLNAIAVSGDHRSNGVGTHLIALTEVASLQAGLSRLSLHVWVDNVAAIRLYKRHGFAEVGIAELADTPRLPHSGGSMLMRKILPGPAAGKSPA